MENNTTEIIESIQEVSPEIIYQQDKAAIDVQISTAKAYPRNIKRATDNAIAIVTIDIETAKTCTYSVPRGGRAITGQSVHLAKILAQVWGNMRIEAKVVSIDAKQITSEAVCFDLETNLAMKAQVKRSIMGRTGRFNDDMITVTGNAANSIALRNAIFSVIPRAIVDKVYNESKKMITGDVSDNTKLIAKRKQVVDALKDTYGVTEKEILSAIGKAAIEHIMGDDLVVLIGIGTAIKDGDTTVEQAFRSKTNGIGITKTTEDHEKERLESLIKDCKTPKELEKVKKTIPADKLEQVQAAINLKMDEFLSEKES